MSGRTEHCHQARCGKCGKLCRHGGSLASHFNNCGPEALARRFWSKVIKREGCWGWTGDTRWDGYGRFRYLRKAVFAHRVSYELHHGPIPAGMGVMHSCDTPECVNPAHLSLGSHDDNMLDKRLKGRCQSKVTPAQVREMKEAFKTSYHGQNRDLGAKYGISSAQVSSIRTGKRWTHIN